MTDWIKTKQFGRALRRARKQTHTGRTRLSQILGISRRDIFKYETCQEHIPYEVLLKLFSLGIDSANKSE